MAYGGVDIALLCLVVLYVVSAVANGRPVSWTIMSGALPYILLYAAARLCFCLADRWLQIIAYAVLCLWTVYESALGLSQLLGFAVSGHAGFPMTGTFFNPGPFGGLVASGMSCAAVYLFRYRGLLSGKVRSEGSLAGYAMLVLSTVTVIAGILVLPASMSRAGWVGLCTALAIYVYRETSALNWMKHHRWLTAAVCAVCIALAAGAFLLKRDSALGRLHIWEMELRAISESPVIGYGPGLAMGAYGHAQEEYFAGRERPEQRVRVAGCPEYAFNEYLKTGMETGVAGLAISVLAVFMAVAGLLRKGSVLGYAMIAFAVYSFFSYPLSVPSTACLAVLLLAASGKECRSASGTSLWTVTSSALLAACVLTAQSRELRKEAEKEYASVRQWVGMELYEDAAEELAPLYGELQHDAGYLYDYGYSLYRSGEYVKGIEVLTRGAEISSDPMFRNITGRCLEALGDCDGAEKEYLTAHYMVPCRLYPLTLLMDMYISSGRTGDAVRTGETILAMPVNERHPAMSKMKRETEEKLVSLKNYGADN